jgi:hypothetical protein
MSLEDDVRRLLLDDEDDNTATTSASDTRGGVLPDAYTDETMRQRPGVTPNPGAATVFKPRTTTDAGVTVTEVPTNPELDPDNKLANNAEEILKKSIADLMPADANIGLGFNDDWIRRLGSTAVPYTGLGQDFTRKTGVNDASHRKTLQYSRLVDALNNKRFISPGQAGVRSTYASNGGRTGRSDAIDYGNVYKMDGLETAESRAQRRAEGYEEEEAKREIKRTQDVKDMPAIMERLKQLAVLDQAQGLTNAQRAEQQQLFAALVNNQYNIPYMMMQERFRTQLGMDQQQYYTALAMDLQRYAAMNGFRTQEYAAKLGMDQARYNTMLSSVLQQFGTKLAEYMARVTGYQLPKDKVDSVMANPDYLSSIMHGNAWQVGSPDYQARLFAQSMQQMGVDLHNPDIDVTLTAIQRLDEKLAQYSKQSADTAKRTLENEDKDKK